MWPALLLCSSASGLALGLARLKVWALIPATTVLSLTVAIGGAMFGLRWGMIALTVIAAAHNIAILLPDRGTAFRGPKPASGPAHKLATGLSSRSAIRNWRGTTNLLSDTARFANTTSDQNEAIGSSIRLNLVRFATGLGGLGLLGWRRKRKAQAVA
jgi:hypothetical protein